MRLLVYVPGSQSAHFIVASVVGLNIALGAGADIGDSYLCANNGSAAGVNDGAS